MPVFQELGLEDYERQFITELPAGSRSLHVQSFPGAYDLEGELFNQFITNQPPPEASAEYVSAYRAKISFAVGQKAIERSRLIALPANLLGDNEATADVIVSLAAAGQDAGEVAHFFRHDVEAARLHRETASDPDHPLRGYARRFASLSDTPDFEAIRDTSGLLAVTFIEYDPAKPGGATFAVHSRQPGENDLDLPFDGVAAAYHWEDLRDNRSDVLRGLGDWQSLYDPGYHFQSDL